MKSRRLRKKSENRLPVIIYTDQYELEKVRHINKIWIGTTSWPCIIAGPEVKFYHPHYSEHEYTIFKENNE